MAEKTFMGSRVPATSYVLRSRTVTGVEGWGSDSHGPVHINGNIKIVAIWNVEAGASAILTVTIPRPAATQAAGSSCHIWMCGVNDIHASDRMVVFLSFH
jgi:hypothetical protein